ncbi:MAG: phage late control D family protein [Spirochaetales bacterium]|nr:phage late control D family protein [Spirochaetales bacterium]
MSNGSSSVPSFILYINNTRIPPEREAEVKKIIIIDRVNAPSSFAIYTADIEGEWANNDDYFIGSKVKILLGNKNEVEELMVGEITGIKSHYKKNEATRVTISGQNLLHRLKRFKRTQAFSEITVKDIITEIADGAGLKAQVDALSYEHSFTLQREMTDFEYLLFLSDRYDCYFSVNNTDLTFKRIQLNAAEDLVLEYGKTLLEFYPEADTSKIVSEMEVLTWDPAKHEGISGKVTFQDINAKGGNIVDDQFGGAPSVYIDAYVLDQNGADQRATDLLARNNRDYVTGRGTTFGNPVIRAGTIIKVEGLGNKFSGKYFILSAMQQLIPLQGYTTSFTFTSSLGSPTQSSAGAEAAGTESAAAAAKEEEEQEEEKEEEKQRIEFHCYDRAHHAVINQKYLLITPDGEEKGETDEEGKIIKEEVTEGECTIKFYFNEDTDVTTELDEGTKYPTGKNYTLSFPTIELHLEIDPNNAESIDDKYILFSTDDNKYFKRTFTVKDDKIPGNEYVDLFFPGIDPQLNYSLKIDPGAGGEPYFMFENMSYDELKD